jgi:acyl carrier protein phosphodiesterase
MTCGFRRLRKATDDFDRRARSVAALLADIESDESLAAHWTATAPDIQRAYLEWAVKPRRARERRRRKNALLAELIANERLHYQPRTASWTDVLGF